MSKVNDFVDFVRDATYQLQKPIDALFWEVVFHFGTFVNNEKDGKKPTKCKFEPDCAIKTMEKIYPLRRIWNLKLRIRYIVFLSVQYLEAIVKCNRRLSSKHATFVPAFRSYCMRCQRILRGAKWIFSYCRHQKR